MFRFFFFNDTATTEIYTLSLHDALPIYGQYRPLRHVYVHGQSYGGCRDGGGNGRAHADAVYSEHRSEEHTSELQSRSDLVCRLLLEKKKAPRTSTTCSHSPSRRTSSALP